MDDFGLKAHKPARKACLKQAMKNRRLAFAKKNAIWTKQQWSKVLIFDESTVQQFTTRKRCNRRPIGTQFDERYTTQTMKDPPNVMIWGGMSVMEELDSFFFAC